MSIQLIRYVSEDHHQKVPSRKQVWPLRIVATALAGEDPAVFVYHVGGQPLDPTQDDIFECVASPTQMKEIPVLKPLVLGAECQIPYYRSSELLYFCRSAAEAEYIWDNVQKEVTLLLENLDSENHLSSDETVTLYGPDETTTTTTTTRTTSTTTTTTTTTPPPPTGVLGETGQALGGETGGTVAPE